MMKKALLEGLKSGRIAAGELYNLDDEGLFALARERSLSLFALMDSVRNGPLFTAAAGIPFNETAHAGLLDIMKRSAMEESLGAELSPLLGRGLTGDSLVIDLCEPVTFESGLFVTDENCFFPDSSSAFKSSLVDAFVKSIRIIRVFVDSTYEEKINIHRERILHITQKWLQLYK